MPYLLLDSSFTPPSTPADAYQRSDFVGATLTLVSSGDSPLRLLKGVPCYHLYLWANNRGQTLVSLKATPYLALDEEGLVALLKDVRTLTRKAAKSGFALGTFNSNSTPREALTRALNALGVDQEATYHSISSMTLEPLGKTLQKVEDYFRLSLNEPT